MLHSIIYDHKLLGRRQYIEIGILLIVGRLTWAILQWMGRLYILTDLRIIRLSGVFSVDLFDCPLRKVASTRLTTTMRERLFGLGSIEISPSDSDCPAGQWQTISSPREVHEQIVAPIN